LLSAPAYGQQTDGNWWVEHPNSGEPLIAVQNLLIRSWFVSGILEGAVVLGGRIAMETVTKDVTAQSAEEGRYQDAASRYFGRVSKQQIIDGLDVFYNDFRNRNIFVAVATRSCRRFPARRRQKLNGP
jgi:hypothetical protein